MPYFLTLLAINLAVIAIAFYKHKYAPASKRFFINEDYEQ